MELDVLHRAVAPEIVEFYGAFFIESCVYYCMEYMDAGSMDKLQVAGVPEEVLAKIALSMVKGLKFLKDGLQIIHRGEWFVSYHLQATNFSFRCETYQRPREQEGRNQVVRFWSLGSTRKVARQN
jgi:hypothetical protein